MTHRSCVAPHPHTLLPFCCCPHDGRDHAFRVLSLNPLFPETRMFSARSASERASATPPQVDPRTCSSPNRSCLQTHVHVSRPSPDFPPLSLQPFLSYLNHHILKKESTLSVPLVACCTLTVPHATGGYSPDGQPASSEVFVVDYPWPWR